MIARIWRGVTSGVHRDEYFGYLTKTGLKDYRSTAGNRGVLVLRRVSEGWAEFALISFWDSVDSIRKFAGRDVDKAVYYPEDERFLREREPKVVHYELLFSDSDSAAQFPQPL
jgi:heme-degrading monooxygenase HmoA